RVPPQERNLLRIVLTDKRYQSDPVAYDAMVRRLVGEFRVDFGRCARDPEFQSSSESLSRSCQGSYAIGGTSRFTRSSAAVSCSTIRSVSCLSTGSRTYRTTALICECCYSSLAIRRRRKLSLGSKHWRCQCRILDWS